MDGYSLDGRREGGREGGRGRVSPEWKRYERYCLVGRAAVCRGFFLQVIPSSTTRTLKMRHTLAISVRLRGRGGEFRIDTAKEMECRHNYSSLRRFGVVEPPRTHLKLPCRPYSPCSTVVRGGSVWSNHPELTRNCPVGHIPLVSGPQTAFRLTYMQRGNSCVISDTNCLPSTEVE